MRTHTFNYLCLNFKLGEPTIRPLPIETLDRVHHLSILHVHGTQPIMFDFQNRQANLEVHGSQAFGHFNNPINQIIK